MNTIDSYFEYNVPITKNMRVGNHPFISDVRNDVKVDLPNGNSIPQGGFNLKYQYQVNFIKAVNTVHFLKRLTE